MLFEQSISHNEIKWQRFCAEHGFNSNDATFETPVYNESLLLALNSYNFQKQLFNSVTKAPLTTIFSAAWTLCVNACQGENEVDLLTSWYPLTLLHKYCEKLQVLLGKSPSKYEAFNVADLRDSVNELKSKISSYRDREHYEKEAEVFAKSRLFQKLIEKTSTGGVKVEVSGQSIVSMCYVTDLSLLDYDLTVGSFDRVKIFERLRVRYEASLRTDVSVEKVEVNHWMLPGVRVNGQVIRYWQYQFSTILWFVLHSLFALNQLVQDDNLTEDLLFFVTDYLHKFVDCGICKSHWKEIGEKMWKARRDLYILETSNLGGNTHSKASVYARLYEKTLDWEMLQTHNYVQRENVDPSASLTEATIRGLQNDYAQYALVIMGALMLKKGQKTSDFQAHHATRNDVVAKVEHLFTGKLAKLKEDDLQVSDTELKLSSLETQRRVLNGFFAL